MPSGDLVARIRTNNGAKGVPKSILEASLAVQREILMATSKCAAITKLGAVPARVVDFELFRGKTGIDKIVIHYENPTRPSGPDNYFEKTFGTPYFYSIPNDGNL